jgi:hypothetical protein
MCLTVYRDVPQWHRGDHFSSGMAGFRSPQEGGELPPERQFSLSQRGGRQAVAQTLRPTYLGVLCSESSPSNTDDGPRPRPPCGRKNHRECFG